MILIWIMIIQMTSHNIMTEFELCKKNSNLETLSGFDKKTPKFTLKNSFKMCKIVDVYDGDTIRGVFENNGVYNKWTIRMFGYDSPEMRPSRKLENRDEIKRKAKESRDYLKSKILGKTIFLHCLDFDKYGRVLANVYSEELGDKSINEHMVEMNYGYTYFGGTKKK
jgi:endonuclease YncB( thermonuclease family)